MPGNNTNDTNRLRILGIDPGLKNTGFGVLECQGVRLHYVASGTVNTVVGAPLPERLQALFQGLQTVCERYQPDCAAVEIVFVNVNPQATLLLGQARGACLTTLVAAGVPVVEYSALQMKQAVTGYGKASKPQVQEMVKRLLHLPVLPGKDAADALGMAITHAHVRQTGWQYTGNLGKKTSQSSPFRQGRRR